jgi:hypothetical protein
VICPFCSKEVIDSDYMMIGLDRPYINLMFHRECYNKIKSNLNEYLGQSFQEWYNLYINNEEIHGKRVRKSRKTRKSS